MLWRSILSISFFCVAAPSFAQSSSVVQDSLTIEQAVATALENNYDILLSRNDSAAAAIDFEYRNAAFLPRVNATSSFVLNNNAQNQTLADGTKRNSSGLRSNNLASSVGLNWTLFDGLRMFATRDKAEEYLRLGSLVIKQQVVNTVADVITTYYNMVRQKQQLRAIEEQIAVNEDRYKLAKYRLDIGVGVKPDVLQAQLDLNAQKAAQINQLTLMEQLRQQLNALMNVETTASYKVSDSIPIQMDLTLGEAQNNLESTNPTLLITRKNIDIAGLTLKERKAERFPTINFNSAYSFNRSDNKAVINPFQPLFSQNRGLNYGLSATIPIFNGFNARRLIRQAELAIDNQELLFESQQRQISTAVNTAFITYEMQKKALTLEEANIELARENLFIARERYRLAAANFLELREAQRSLEDANTRLINARYNMKVAETELLRLKGNIVR